MSEYDDTAREYALRAEAAAETATLKAGVATNAADYAASVATAAVSQNIEAMKTAAQTAASSAAASATAASNSAVASSNSASQSASATAQAEAVYASVLATVATYYVGPAYGYGVTVSGTVLSFTWSDPADNDVVRWAKTRLVMKQGGFPANERDGTTLVDSTVRNRYKVHPFTWDAGSTSDYYFALFTQTTGGVWNTGDDCPRFTTDAMTWATIAMMTRAGTLMQYPGMSIGSVVPIRVNSLYPALRYKLAHVDYSGTFTRVEDFIFDSTRSHNSIWMPNYLPCLGENTSASMLQFDAPELSYGATWDSVFIPGKTYYRASGEGYVAMTAGTDYADGSSVASWQTSHGATVFTKNHADRVYNGYDSWKESPVRQWMNKSGDDWFVKQNEYDVKPSSADYGAGWLTGFDAGFLSIVMPVRNKTARNTTGTNIGGGGGGYDITLDTFWLPSMKEFNNADVNGIAEGSQLAYFRDVATTSAQRIQYDEGGNAKSTWLRSPNPSDTYNVSNITTGGVSSSLNLAKSAYAVLPLVCVA